MDEIALTGNVYDDDCCMPKRRVSPQCKNCNNYTNICKFDLIPHGSKNYRLTAPWGKCKQKEAK